MHPSDDLKTDRPTSSAGPAETTTDPVPLAQSRLERTGYATLRRVRFEFQDGLLS